ncbi:Protein NRT1/ PTR FAMILY 5.5 like [Actinidia chinensis var. chinensis]|uniref:Protein NRT1/ PTR FAMILY 5.5 like n=1 Tax=Actinidia chinensis var. chinensis TaxID=1590841 RepID=A0A2R6R8D3_ACTCC|nr:Protein NRT1/ PTR FAMILY 5.5 like [Actinidia chinensis var. chinensis]
MLNTINTSGPCQGHRPLQCLRVRMLGQCPDNPLPRVIGSDRYWNVRSLSFARHFHGRANCRRSPRKLHHALMFDQVCGVLYSDPHLHRRSPSNFVHKLWSIRFGIPAICTVVATIIFLSGSCSYNCVRPQGSSLTTVFRVLVAATSKIFHKRPSDANQLYEKCDPDIVLLPHSRRLRCLDKAAIIQPTQPLEEQEKKRWKLCTVTEVENTKLSLRMIPLCATLIFCGVVSSIGNTYFIEQANHLNHKVGRLSIPTVILFLFYNQGKQQFANLYYKIANLLGGSRSRKYAPTIGIGVSMIFAILCCVTAAKVEIRRLDVVKSHGLIDKPDVRIPMSIFWLLPQFILDGILESSISALLINQVGPSMVRYAIHFALGVIGLGNIGGVLSVHEVGKVSERGGSRPSWFHDTLNKSRLDKYFWTLAWLSAVNLGVYIVVAAFYRYRELKLEDDQEAPT